MLLENDDKIGSLKDAWQNASLPQSQRRLVEAELAAMYAGEAPLLYRVLAEAVKDTGVSRGKLVEVGCSSGFYSEVLAYLLGHSVDYTGIDYSAAFIEMARQCYPKTPFEVGDAAALPLADRACDILISGCVLLHVPDYKKAIAESVRVSRFCVIFHRTPITGGPTRLYEKTAYGVRCLEFSFNEAELLAEFQSAGLRVVREYLVGTGPAGNAEQDCQKTYLCRRSQEETP